MSQRLCSSKRSEKYEPIATGKNEKSEIHACNLIALIGLTFLSKILPKAVNAADVRTYKTPTPGLKCIGLYILSQTPMNAIIIPIILYFDGRSPRRIMLKTIPVSYTHLDVYKRQVSPLLGAS